MSNGRPREHARARRPDPMAKKQKSRTRIAAPSRRRVAPPRGRAVSRAAAALDLHRCEQFLVHEARLLDEAQVRRLAGAVHRRRLVLGAERAGPGQPARHGVADLRRPAAAGDAGAAARQPAHVFAGAALAHQPHRRQRHDRGRRGPRRHRALEIPDDRISPRAAAAVRRHGVAPAGAARRRHPHRLEARRSGELRRAAGWASRSRFDLRICCLFGVILPSD